MAVYEKNGDWWIDVRIKGKRIRRKIGPDQETAELVVKDLQVKAAKGEYLGIMEERKVRFEAFARKDYTKWAAANKSSTSLARDKVTIEKHLIPFFGKKYLAAVTSKHLEDYKTGRAGQVSPRTVNRELDTLKSIFSRAVEWGYLRAHPGQGVKKLKFQKQPPAYLTTEQLERLLTACEHPHWLHAFVALAAYTGMRKSELLRLQWQDVDLGKRVLTVRDTKNNEFRVIPLNQRVCEVLKRHPRHLQSDLVLARPDGAAAYQDLRKSFERALARAGLPRIRIHDLRHSFASNLVSGGISLAVVRELMGHKDIQTTMIYAHLAPNLTRAAVDSLVADGQDMDTNAGGAQKQA